jgi:hypothetical protein
VADPAFEQRHGWWPAITGKPAGQGTRPGSIGRKVERKQLARVESAGTSQPTGDVTCRILNPSRRLTCTFAIVFEPDTVQTLVFPGAAVWTPRGFIPGGDGGREVLVHALETGIAIPRMYELDSMLPGVNIAATLAVVTNLAAATVPGTWVLRAAWEPNQPVCEDEVSSLYTGCNADVVPLTAPLVT